MKKLLLIIVGVLMSQVCSVDVYADMDMIKQFEGFRSQAYTDTVGVRTIGYGFNMSVCGLSNDVMSREEAEDVLRDRHKVAVQDAQAFVGSDVFGELNEVRQDILISMAYNLGYNRLSKFRKMKAAIIAGDYDRAADEMQNSKWYSQVKSRGVHHVKAFREGK